jgi:hypothetical protein
MPEPNNETGLGIIVKNEDDAKRAYNTLKHAFQYIESSDWDKPIQLGATTIITNALLRLTSDQAVAKRPMIQNIIHELMVRLANRRNSSK